MDDYAANTPFSDAALLIDWENLKYSLENRGLRVSISALRDAAEKHGRLVVARAYADWQEHSGDAFNLYTSGIEPVYVPVRRQLDGDGRTRTKNSVDVKLTADCIELIHRFPTINTYILVSGDQDFIHVINTLRPYGKRTVLIGVSWSTSVRLAEQVDAMIYYDSEVSPARAEAPSTSSPPSEIKPEPDAAIRDIAAYLLSSNSLEVSEASVNTMSRLVQAIVEVTTEYRTAVPPRPLLLSQLGIELRSRASQAFSLYGRGRLTPIVATLSDRGLVMLAERGRVDWVFLPGEDVPEEEEEDTGLGVRNYWRPAQSFDEMAEAYDELGDADKTEFINILARLQNQHPFLSFNRLREGLQQSDLHVKIDAGRLLNSAQDARIIVHGEDRPWFDSSTGQSGMFKTFVLNREHPEAVQRLRRE